jgi:alpha-1,3-rhamnosyltransferase
MDNTLFNKERQLVSIAVITYNSSKYVLETLESIASQTYQDLEVIISDDCSTDNTVNICKKWIEKNRDRFVKVELITVNKNTGITPNINRALRMTKGSWVKFIAGDDILFPRAIQSNIEFISQKEHENAVIVVSSVQVFRDNIKKKLYVWPNFKFSNDIRKQLRLLLIGSYIKAPGVFIKREILVNEFKGFDEKYPMLEDDPLWVLFLMNGYKFHFNPEILIGYRVHSTAISHNGVLANRPFFVSLYSFKKDVVFPLMLKNKFYFDFLLNSETYYTYKRKYDKGDYTRLNTRDKIEIFVRRSIRITIFAIIGKLSFGDDDYTYPSPSIKDKIGIVTNYFCWILLRVIHKFTHKLK